jgi:hypothetical protein
MTRADKVPVILRRSFLGTPGPFAPAAMFMPAPWMAAAHRRDAVDN